MVNASNYITVDPEILGGQPVFKGTRVPVESLFDHLRAGVSIQEFLTDFPTVTTLQALTVIDLAGKILLQELTKNYHV